MSNYENDPIRESVTTQDIIDAFDRAERAIIIWIVVVGVLQSVLEIIIDHWHLI